MEKPNNTYARSFFSVFGLIALSIFFIMTVMAVKLQINRSKADSRDDVIYLRLAEIHPANYPSSLGAAEFARLVREKTDGRIEIEVFTSGQLGDDEDSIAEQVQFGGIDFACIDSCAMGGYAPLLDVLQLPYLITDTEHLHKVLDSDLGRQLLTAGDKNKLIGLAFYDEGQRIYCNSLRTVSRTTDLEGLRLGVPKNGLYSTMVELLGTQAESLAHGDVYRSLQTGRVNGLECSLQSYISSRYYVEAKYVTLDNHSMPPDILIASRDVFETLSPLDQQMIREAARQSVISQREACRTAEEKAQEFLKSGRCDVVTNPWTTSVFTARTIPIYDYYRQYSKEIELIKSMK